MHSIDKLIERKLYQSLGVKTKNIKVKRVRHKNGDVSVIFKYEKGNVHKNQSYKNIMKHFCIYCHKDAITKSTTGKYVCIEHFD